jgi:RimJ/RimL family protein N-acetyltransferase
VVPEVALRPAGPEDAERLLAWRNDPEVQAVSFTQGPVAAEVHSAWLERTLSDPGIRLLIVERDGRPAGQIRLQRTGPAAEVHIGLSGEARGQGVGRRALELAAGVAREELGAQSLEARIRSGNERSVRAFRAAGFEEVGSEADELRMRLRL